MSTTTSPTQYAVIIADGSGSLNTASYDLRNSLQSYGISEEYWYHAYVCAPQILFHITAYRNMWLATDTFTIYLYRYSLSSLSWVRCLSTSIQGKGTFSGSDTMWIAINWVGTANDAGTNYNLSYNDAIHYCLALYKTEGHWAMSGSYLRTYVGDFSTCSRYSLMKDNLIYGKRYNTTSGSISALVGYSSSSADPTTNPFSTTWGNVTYNTGSIITSSDKYRAVSLYGYSPP